jgi:hypothetical protein
METLAALNDRDAEFLFKLSDPAGECRLRDAALLGGPGEVLLTGKRNQVLQLADIHKWDIREHNSPDKTNRPQL